MGSSKLVDMHAKCGSIEDVLEMFSKMSIHSVVSWTAMLQDMSCGLGREALGHLNTSLLDTTRS
jgi:pentatricopeptide repeat protein